MAGWSADEFSRIGSAGELRIAGLRADVVFTRDDSKDPEVDQAYRAKYGCGSPVRSITSPLATTTTLRVDPR